MTDPQTSATKDRPERIAAIRAEHKALHFYCKWQRGPHDVYQRLCLDPCHRVKPQLSLYGIPIDGIARDEP